MNEEKKLFKFNKSELLLVVITSIILFAAFFLFNYTINMAGDLFWNIGPLQILIDVFYNLGFDVIVILILLLVYQNYKQVSLYTLLFISIIYCVFIFITYSSVILVCMNIMIFLHTLQHFI